MNGDDLGAETDRLMEGEDVKVCIYVNTAKFDIIDINFPSCDISI